MVSKESSKLRQRAEETLNAHSLDKTPHSSELAKVLQELDTYQIELELQN